MWNAIVDGEMPRFWEPRPARFWTAVLEPPRRWYLRRYYRIAEVVVEGFDDRLSPLVDGVSFLAVCAQRELTRAKPQARVWIVPTAIRYRYVEDIRPKLAATMDRLEERVLSHSPPGMPLDQRILRFGEIL